ncbi:MAG: YgaP family membrane protein [Gaiellales bacterium]
MSAITPEIAEAPHAMRWPLERALFLMAGVFVLASVALAALVSPWFLLLTAFVGLNQLLYVATGTCGAAAILTRAFHLQKGCAR